MGQGKVYSKAVDKEARRFQLSWLEDTAKTLGTCLRVADRDVAGQEELLEYLAISPSKSVELLSGTAMA